LPHPVNVIR